MSTTTEDIRALAAAVRDGELITPGSAQARGDRPGHRCCGAGFLIGTPGAGSEPYAGLAGTLRPGAVRFPNSPRARVRACKRKAVDPSLPYTSAGQRVVLARGPSRDVSACGGDGRVRAVVPLPALGAHPGGFRSAALLPALESRGTVLLDRIKQCMPATARRVGEMRLAGQDHREQLHRPLPVHRASVHHGDHGTGNWSGGWRCSALVRRAGPPRNGKQPRPSGVTRAGPFRVSLRVSRTHRFGYRW